MQINKKECFECGGQPDHLHHVIPKSKGGTKVLPLCHACHGKVHDLNFLNHSELTKAALARKKAEGVKLGRPRKYNQALIDQVKELRAKGLKVRAISSITNISTGYISSILNSN